MKDVENMLDIIYDLSQDHSVLNDNHFKSHEDAFSEAGFASESPDIINDLRYRVDTLYKAVFFAQHPEGKGVEKEYRKLFMMPARYYGNHLESSNMIRLGPEENAHFERQIAEFDKLVSVLHELRVKLEGPVVYNYTCLTKNMWIGNQPNPGQTGWDKKTMREPKRMKLAPAPGMCTFTIIHESPTFIYIC